MKRLIGLLNLLLGIACFAPQNAHAQTAILQNIAMRPYSGVQGVSDWTFGYSLAVGPNPISIVALGLWDADQNGFSGSNQAALWNQAGTLLASVTIQSGTGSALGADSFRYENIIPVILDANATYLVGFYNHGNELVVSESVATWSVASGVSIVSGLNNNQSGFSLPNTGGGIVVGANALYTAVPETSTYAALAGLAVLGLALLKRRQEPAG